MAVATPTGLITPIVKDAGSKGLAAISAETKLLAQKARDGKLVPHEYQVGHILETRSIILTICHSGRAEHSQFLILACTTLPNSLPSSTHHSHASLPSDRRARH